MAKFRLCWTEVYDFEQDVEADNLEQAIELFRSGEINFPDVREATYVDGSTELNTSYTEQINDPVLGLKEEYK